MKTFRYMALALLVVFPLVGVANNASLSLEAAPAEPTASLRVAVVLRSEVPLNAVEGVITLPAEVPFAGIAETSSIISYWITAPAYNANTRRITFAGILLGGKSGTIKLFEFLIRPPASSAVLSFNSGRAFTDSPRGIEMPLVRSPLPLSPAKASAPAGALPYILIGVAAILLALFCLRRVRMRWI